MRIILIVLFVALRMFCRGQDHVFTMKFSEYKYDAKLEKFDPNDVVEQVTLIHDNDTVKMSRYGYCKFENSLFTPELLKDSLPLLCMLETDRCFYAFVLEQSELGCPIDFDFPKKGKKNKYYQFNYRVCGYVSRAGIFKKVTNYKGKNVFIEMNTSTYRSLSKHYGRRKGKSA